MNKIILSFVALLLVSTQLMGQEKENIDKIYSNASLLYEQQKIAEAVTEFEKVIALNPKHTDALYNLAIINYDLGNKDKAIDLLQACARLGDKEAVKIIKDQLQLKIAYADTMLIEIVDITPKVLVNSVEEEMIVNKGMNKAIEKAIITEIKKSKLLRKQVGGGLLVLSIYCGKDGYLNAAILSPSNIETAQAEITSIFRQVAQIVPGKHDGKDVVVKGLTLPIRM